MSFLILAAAALSAETAIAEFATRCVDPMLKGERPGFSDLERIPPEIWAGMQDGSQGAGFRISTGLFLELKQHGQGAEAAYTCAVSPTSTEKPEAVGYGGLHAGWDAWLADRPDPPFAPYLPCDRGGLSYHKGFEATDGTRTVRAFLATHMEADVFLFVVVSAPGALPGNCAGGGS